MGRKLVKQPNGRLAIFSSIVDNFIVYNATPNEIVQFCTDEGGKEARQAAEAWVASEQPGRRHWALDELLPTVRAVHGDDEADSYLEEMSEPQEEPTPVVPIEMGYTQRGFALGEFIDRYGNKCSIQESSLATEAAIWLGIDDPKPEVLVPGKGWQPVDLKALVQGELSIHTRMHLTVDGVRQLLPLLHHFVETGGLPKPNGVTEG